MILYKSPVSRNAKLRAKRWLIPTLAGCGLVFVASATGAVAQTMPLDPPPSPAPPTVPGPRAAERLFDVPGRFEDVRRGTTVRGRFRPEYQPLGVRVGTFVASPALGLQQMYDDNIFATNTDEKSDFITRIQPTLNVQSDWGVHMIGVDLGADIGRYFDHTRESYEDYYTSAYGRLDITRDANLSARAGYQRAHEARDSPDDAGGIEPTEFDVFAAILSYNHRLGLFRLTPDVRYLRYDYKDVPAAGGITISQEDRDRHVVDTGMRVGYEFIRDYEAFVRGAYNLQRYDANIIGEDFKRDSHGFSFVAGLQADLGGLIFGDIFAGYRWQRYDADIFDTTSGPTVGGSVTWNVTPLTTIIGRVSREIEESTVQDPTTGAFASGRFSTNVGLSVDHELLRNLILGAQVGFRNEDYEGIDRVDNVYTVGVDATYLLNRHVSASAGYRFQKRDSDLSVDDFSRNLFLVRLQTRY